MKIPASCIQVSLFRIWQVESHVQQGSVFDPSEIGHGCLTFPLMSSHLESARNLSSVFPTYWSSTR